MEIKLEEQIYTKEPELRQDGSKWFGYRLAIASPAFWRICLYEDSCWTERKLNKSAWKMPWKLMSG